MSKRERTRSVLPRPGLSGGLKAFRRILPALCVAACAFGQPVDDPNALIAQASAFARSTMEAQGDPEELELRILGATPGGASGAAHAAEDLRHWVLTYEVPFPERTAPRHGGVAQHSVNVDWRQGGFTDFAWSPVPVMACRSLQGVPIGVTVREAIRSLNGAGCTGGFSSVNLVWPADRRGQDGPAYVFLCAGDAASVGISAWTGALLWRDQDPS